jgi:hypothetical protein
MDAKVTRNRETDLYEFATAQRNFVGLSADDQAKQMAPLRTFWSQTPDKLKGPLDKMMRARMSKIFEMRGEKMLKSAHSLFGFQQIFPHTFSK